MIRSLIDLLSFTFQLAIFASEKYYNDDVDDDDMRPIV